MSNIFELDKQYIASTYARFPLEIVSAKGSIFVDSNGKEYIDLGSGIGVTSFGACDETWVNAVTKQLNTYQHTSNLYYSGPCVKLAEILTKKANMSKCFFSNSGAEANECAVKVARKWASENKGSDYNTIVTLWNSFHGRTLTTLSLTGQDHYHELYQPLTKGIMHIHAEDLKEAEEVLKNNKVAGVLVECVQGEGGVNIISKEYIEGLYQLTQKYNCLFMVDEVQTGNGRCGKLYSYMNYNVSPDVVSTAKGLGGGLPIGCTLLSDKVKDVFGFGDNGSTFGGNPVVCAGAYTIIDRINDELLEEVNKKGNYVVNELKNAEGVESVSGLGLMIGIKPTKVSARTIVDKCLEKGLMCLTAKDKVRLLPALNIKQEDLEKAVSILKEVLKENA